jgi:hypothetical protein
MRYPVAPILVLFCVAGAAQVVPAKPSAKGRSTQNKDKPDRGCLGCHDSVRLAEIKKQQGNEIIPEDPCERAAFAGVIGESNPRRLRDAAKRCLSTYPQSWVLEPVYELAAKASIALGETKAALDFGARSLRLLPVNPFLLVPLSVGKTAGGDSAETIRGLRTALNEGSFVFLGREAPL